MNRGKIVDGVYIKHTNINKAVLWKSKELSLPVDVMQAIKTRNCHEMRFIDDIKKTVWRFKTNKVYKLMHLMTVGQEEQYYFPIGIKEAEEKKPEKKKEPDKFTFADLALFPEEQMNKLKVMFKKK